MADAALTTIFPDRVLRRPAALEATRICGFTDSEIARLGSVSAMTVSEWVSGKRPIPRFRHQALCLFVYSLTNVYFSAAELEFAPRTAHALRARLLRQAIDPLLDLAVKECQEPTEYTEEEILALLDADPDLDEDLSNLLPKAWYTAEAATLANQMLERLRSWVLKP
jgi:transcriptional regulator with XRE-family HTH domain